MNIRLLTPALGVLFFLAGAAGAQTQGDPISGIWNGYIARDGSTTDRIELIFTLALKDGAISGRAEGPKAAPGVIKSGKFDPSSGAVTFEVAAQDQERSFVFFEGKLAGDKMEGKVTLNNQTGVFSLSRAQSGADRPAALQDRMSTAEALRKSFAEVHGHITRAVEMIPADKFGYRPAASVRTVGQLLGHIADGYNYFCSRAAGRGVDWSDATANGATDKAAVAAALKKAGDGCSSAYAGGAEPMLLQNLNHTNQHYGNLVTYIRLLGLTPPSSQ